MNRVPTTLAAALAVGIAGCESDLARPELPTEGAAEVRHAPEGSYELAAPVYDIAAAPDGSLLVADGDIIKEISRNGIREIVVIPTVKGEGPIGVPAVTPINGLEAIGRGNFFATRGGLDEAEGAALWRASPGGARLVADIERFEQEHDPDAREGPQWKDLQCEAAQGYTPGPQSNPFHLTALSGSEVLVADAAGNTLLWVRTNGDIDWVAVFTPPVNENSDYLVLETLPDGTECYVQPVPTAVAVGPDGAYYVGELTGAVVPPLDVARVWRIEPGSRHVVCPSADCQEVISGLTAVIDLAFGPDGNLYVVEYDENGWLAPLVESIPLAGGTIKRCGVSTGACTIVEDGLTLPGAITFDKWGSLWVVESNLIAPEVRRVDLP